MELNFSHDFLHIYDGNQKVEELTGVIVPSTIRSFTSNMTIRFQSDEYGVTSGFTTEIEYVIIGKPLI